MGLGSYPDISLSMARERALQARRLAADGIDPIEQRRVSRKTPTFAAVVAEFMPIYEGEVVDAKRWLGRLKANVWSRLSDKPIDEIDREKLSSLLLDIHERAPGTSDKIAQALSRIFRFALGRGYIDTNSLDAAKAALPRDFGSRAKRHRPMVQINDVPDFYSALIAASQGRGEISILALKFLCLSGVRSQEVRLARWEQFSGDEWRVPASNTKTKQSHAVPLTTDMHSILDRTAEIAGRSGLIFPGERAGRPLSDMTLAKRMKGFEFHDSDGRLAVPHGLRASLKTWAQDRTTFDPALVERVLGHVVKGDVQKAYDRADMFEKRRAVLEAWALFAVVARHAPLEPGKVHAPSGTA